MRKSRKFWVRLGLAVVVLWLAADVALIALAYGDAKRGRDSLNAARHDATGDGLRTGSIDSQLKRSSTLLARSHSKLHNPLLRPLHWLPIAGRQIESADDLTGAGAKVTKVALDSLTQARALTGQIKTDRGGSLAKLGTISENADAQLISLDLGPDHALIGPLARARNDVSSAVGNIHEGLVRATAGAKAVSQLFSKDGRYLVVAANNGEMRSGSGMFLSVGTMTTGGGDISLGSLETVGGLDVPKNSVKWPQEIQDRWGFMGFQSDMRNLMLSPRFDQSAPVAAQVWKAAGRGDVDGVLVIDPGMLKALLAATGPVQADGKSITTNNVLDELFVQQYKDVSTTGSTAASQAARREGLSAVASGAFAALNRGSWDPVVLARELGRAASARHVLLWSADPTQNDNWKTAGVGGTLTDDSMMLSSINVGANKLDHYLQISSTVAQVTGPSGIEMSVSVKVQNTATLDLPKYVVGPSPGTGLVAGEYSGLLSFSLPGDATSVRFDDPKLGVVAVGTDGPNQMVAANYRLKAGESKTMVLRFTRSALARHTVVEPSARIPATAWRYGNQTWVDDHAHVISH